jgi:hypothetical protein
MRDEMNRLQSERSAERSSAEDREKQLRSEIASAQQIAKAQIEGKGCTSYVLFQTILSECEIGLCTYTKICFFNVCIVDLIWIYICFLLFFVDITSQRDEMRERLRAEELRGVELGAELKALERQNNAQASTPQMVHFTVCKHATLYTKMYNVVIYAYVRVYACTYMCW